MPNILLSCSGYKNTLLAKCLEEKLVRKVSDTPTLAPGPAEMFLFSPPYTGQIRARNVAQTPFRAFSPRGWMNRDHDLPLEERGRCRSDVLSCARSPNGPGYPSTPAARNSWA